MQERLFWIAQRLQNLAEVGLLYPTNAYDQDRNQEVRALALEVLSLLSGYTMPDMALHLPLATSYPTPKVDVRALVFNDASELLMVRERADGCWAPPGGWADPGFTPKEVAEKECLEEAGLAVKAEEVWAVVDKKGWGHPTPLYATYKIFMYCTASTYSLAPGYEVLDAAFFAQDALPELSEERITHAQLAFIFSKKSQGPSPTLFN